MSGKMHRTTSLCSLVHIYHGGRASSTKFLFVESEGGCHHPHAPTESIAWLRPKRLWRRLFPVLACATRALFSVQLLARVVFSGVCLVISLGSEFLYLINSCVRDFVQFRCKRQFRGFVRCPLLGEGGVPLVGSSVSPPSPPNFTLIWV